ncbi:MAG: CpXC domain-containing protein [Anaerolineales bacterium]
MPRTTVSCPNCRRPVPADINQIFDVADDPSAKSTLLSGSYNVIQCPSCGYTGNVPTPVVYHDPEKELLLTYVPPELGLPRNEQERLIGSLINQVVNRLPQEKRKGYLLRPQETLTMQGLVERVLEADGITREMIQEQQKKLNLIQRLLSASEDSRQEIAEQEDELIDAEFFTLISRIAEAALAGGDQAGAQQLAQLQQSLLPVTTFGRQLQEQTQEIEAAVAELQEAGDQLTRDKLLDLVVKAPNDTRLRAFVSLARPGMDYEFFRLLSERIERARGDGRARLISIRDKLLQYTQEIDQQVAQRQSAAKQMLESILQADDPVQALEQNLAAVDEFFLQELNTQVQTARQEGDLQRSAKLQELLDFVKSLSSAPPEVAFIEELLDAPDEPARRQLLDENKEQVTPELINALTNIVAQVEANNDPELAAQIKDLHRQVLRYSMQLNLGG